MLKSLGRCQGKGSYLWPFVLALVVTQVPAVTTNWTNNSGGSFGSSGNWDNGVPDQNDLAVFRRGNVSYGVLFLSAAAVESARITDHGRCHADFVAD